MEKCITKTPLAAAGHIRRATNNVSNATFRHRAMNFYTSVPVEIRTGSTNYVKSKLKKWIKANIPID